ncbi:MAG: PEP-CTERM sorting domain-containing protein [Opitutus sp.]|nr:PEP-CTERM sorting domain-containing protein [Opitutus sp.]
MKISNSPLFSGKTTAMLVAALALLGTGQLGAQTAVSNLGEGITASSFYVGFSSTQSTQRDLVFSFTTGATASSFDFTGASVTFTTGGGSRGSPSGLTFGLFSTFVQADGVSNQLATLTAFGANQPPTTGLATFSGSATLAASTTYYLKLSAPTAGLNNNYGVSESATVNQSGLTGWLIGDSSFVYENGAFLGTGGATSFSVQASAIPEPSTYAAIAGAAMLGVAGWQRRRRQASTGAPATNAAA